MPLPVVPMIRSSVTIGDTEVSFHAMSRANAMAIAKYKGHEVELIDEFEVFILMSGTDCSEDEAKAFRRDNGMDTAGILIDAIMVLSNLAEADATTDPKPPSSAPS